MYEALIADLKNREKEFVAASKMNLDFCRIHGAVEALEAMNAEIAVLQAENAELMAEIRGYCWCCTQAEKWDKALPGSQVRACKYLRELGIAASGGRRRCPRWQWRGAQGEA